jgi:hypothetical protein
MVMDQCSPSSPAGTTSGASGSSRTTATAPRSTATCRSGSTNSCTATTRDCPGWTPPLVVKLDNHHFAVHGEAGVPEDTLAVPDHVVGDGDNPPALREILLAKADRAAQLLRLSGQMDDPDGQVGI